MHCQLEKKNHTAKEREKEQVWLQVIQMNKK